MMEEPLGLLGAPTVLERLDLWLRGPVVWQFGDDGATGAWAMSQHTQGSFAY